MVVAKRQGRGKPAKNRTKEGPRTGVRTSGRKKQHSWLAQFTWGKSRGRKKTYKRGAEIGLGASLLFASFGLAGPHALRMYFPLLSK